MPTTELANLSLKAGTDLESGDTQKVFQDILATIVDQAGCEGVNYGRQHESPDILELAIDWTKYEDHISFTKTPAYEPFIGKISTLITGAPKLHHANYRTPFSAVAVAAPVVEMLLLYLPVDGADEKAAEEMWDAFMKALAENAEGYVASASGWVMEELEHENVQGKARGFQAAIGWTGVEAHMKYRETEGFKEGIQVVRGVFKGSAVHHTSFTRESKI